MLKCKGFFQKKGMVELDQVNARLRGSLLGPREGDKQTERERYRQNQQDIQTHLDR